MPGAETRARVVDTVCEDYRRPRAQPMRRQKDLDDTVRMNRVTTPGSKVGIRNDHAVSDGGPQTRERRARRGAGEGTMARKPDTTPNGSPRRSEPGVTVASGGVKWRGGKARRVRKRGSCRALRLTRGGRRGGERLGMEGGTENSCRRRRDPDRTDISSSGVSESRVRAFKTRCKLLGGGSRYASIRLGSILPSDEFSPRLDDLSPPAPKTCIVAALLILMACEESEAAPTTLVRVRPTTIKRIRDAVRLGDWGIPNRFAGNIAAAIRTRGEGRPYFNTHPFSICRDFDSSNPPYMLVKKIHRLSRRTFTPSNPYLRASYSREDMLRSFTEISNVDKETGVRLPAKVLAEGGGSFADHTQGKDRGRPVSWRFFELNRAASATFMYPDVGEGTYITGRGGVNSEGEMLSSTGRAPAQSSNDLELAIA
ncbi:hypothetical protein B0H11DRAFT_2189102 [Mycena galericulata]|nr:hypothetical protein B0H11DRAFT_2189102 [Mycena galericulata]